MIEDFLRTNLRRLLTKEKDLALEDKIPSLEDLGRKFQDIDEFGLYLHIPFCEQICPYCPYNKEIYSSDIARKYTLAVKTEIDFYSDIVGNKPITSFYIGGGTPTTMLYSGIATIIEHIYDKFNMQCEIHMESHPNHLSSDNLDTMINVLKASGDPKAAKDAMALTELKFNQMIEIRKINRHGFRHSHYKSPTCRNKKEDRKQYRPHPINMLKGVEC